MPIQTYAVGRSDLSRHESRNARESVDGGAHDDLLAFAPFPYARWRQIRSTNRLAAVNTEIKRRTEVVGAFPNPAALLRLAGHVLIEQHDEWDNAERRYFSEHFMTPLDTTEEEVTIPELAAAPSRRLADRSSPTFWVGLQRWWTLLRARLAVQRSSSPSRRLVSE